MKTQMRLVTSVILAALCCTACATKHLIRNPGFENPLGEALPPGWTETHKGLPAVITTDTSDKRAGKSSVKLAASDFTRSYVVSESFPVVPGETIVGSAWVKVQDVPADHGMVIMIAEFMDPTGQDSSVEKFNVADLKKTGWQKIEGTATVPANAVALRLRLGFSYAKGTCWWDDVKVSAKEPLVARIDLPEPRLSPAMETLPVVIVNRDARKADVRAKLTLNKETVEKAVTLDGSPEQRIEIPIAVPKPGKVTTRLELLSKASESKSRFATTMPALQVPFALAFPPVSPTHWVVEDGPAKIEGRIDLAMADAVRDGATLRAQVRNAAGKVIASWVNEGKVEDGITPFSIDAKDATEGSYVITAQLLPKTGKAILTTQPWHVIPRRKAKVTINDAGFPEHDGKAIFPLGIFNGGRWQEQADAGFTVTHAYNAARISPGPRPQDAEAKKWLDQSEALGMKMVLMVPMRMVIDGDWEGVRRRVRLFRNHPGLLAWDEEEGFARGDFKPDTLERLTKIIREEDPHHPWLVGDCRGLGMVRAPDRSNFFPHELMDLGMWWWYPFPLKARAADALEGEDATAGTEINVPSFLTTAKTTKPIWLGVQAYKKKDQRYPTPAEYRGQAYLAITGGAKGLMWYGGSVTGGLFLKPDEGRWDALQKVARELKDLSPELMGQTLEPPTVSPASATISVIVKKSANRTILIAVNRSTKPVDAAITTPLIKPGGVKRVYEDGTPTMNGEAIQDHFEPFGVHVYEVR